MENKFSPNDTLHIPAMMMPGFRSTLAIQNGVQKKLLFKTWGGIGDQICAEPTLRYAINHFKDCKIYLASEIPELFSHLKFEKVFDLKDKENIPNWNNYFVFETITPPNDTNMVWQFFSHLLTNCVDFPSMCALRMQLPISEKMVSLPDDIRLPGDVLREKSIAMSDAQVMADKVFIHAGKHWPSKTFPKEWWNSVIDEIQAHGALPVLIGANTDDNRGTVDVDTLGCLDLRNKLSVSESILILKSAKVLLTNDSSPLHMAVDSRCWIGFIATCKHPDMITHWRNEGSKNNLEPVWGWRMKNHSRGGIWDLLDFNPNSGKDVKVEEVDEAILKSWLPDPKEYAQWACNKLK